MKTIPRVLRPQGNSQFVFLCDHATNFVPAELQDLGLPASQLARHIAWDIGAAGVTANLSETFDAPAIFSFVSRLVVDCNRHPDAFDLIPEVSDKTVIPGNRHLSQTDRKERLDRWFLPYHHAVESVLSERERRGQESIVISIHSMTESLAGVARPWKIAFSTCQERRLAEVVMAALREFGEFLVGDNQPYDLDPAIDYSIPFHAMRRNLRYLQVEFRQLEIADSEGQQLWAQRFAAGLKYGLREASLP
jgi:predicted N-formylglutamate amidohydrolase